MADHVVRPRGPFSLASSIRFLEGFAPISTPASDAGLDLAFPIDGRWDAAGAHVEERDGAVHVRLSAECGELDDVGEESALAQVVRILSLDVDGTGFAEVGAHDPVVRGLQERTPGLRPVCFWSPYEAAAWCVIGNRIRMVQAAAIKQRMADELGARVAVGGAEIAAFPAPDRLLDLDGFPGLTSQKVERLHAVAQAALAGLLDAARLRELPTGEALASIQRVHGLGPFAAALVLLRGAGEPDQVPAAEPRFARAVEHSYGRPFEGDELAALTAGWSPYRTWVTLLLRVALEQDTHEIAGGGRRAHRAR